ncbi:MAG TPA: MBL fold metallo-hydrolase, partial [Candidatus Limnocylindria bacterium]
MSDTTPMVERSQGAAEHAPRIEVGAFPPWDTNAYLVWDGTSPEALILDPGMSSTASLVES